MAGKKSKRLSQIARELNVSLSHLTEYLQKIGKDIKGRPNEKVSATDYEILLEEFSSDKNAKKESKKIHSKLTNKQENSTTEQTKESPKKLKTEQTKIKKSETEEPKQKAPESHIPTTKPTIKKPEIVSKIDLDNLNKPKKEEGKKENIQKEEPKKEPTTQPTPKVEKTPEPKKEEPKKTTSEKEPVKTEEQKQPKIEKNPESKTEFKVEKKVETKVKPKHEVKPEQKTDSQSTKKVKNETKPPKKETTKTTESESKIGLQITGKIDLTKLNQKTRPKRKSKIELKKEREARRATEEILKEKRLQEKNKEKEKATSEKQPEQKEKTPEFIETKVDKLSGLTVVGKIDLKETEQKKKPSRKKKRKRIKKQLPNSEKPTTNKRNEPKKRFSKKDNHRSKRVEIKEEDINKTINETLAKLEQKGTKNTFGAKNRKEKRKKQQIEREIIKEQELANSKIIKVTEFISANELANIMEVSVNDVIKKCFELGKMVSINQRLDADTIDIVADEFGIKVEFVSLENDQNDKANEEEDESKLEPRPPIVTVMGHVDHGKTSLLDSIRNANVIAGEAGGITQHISAYNVELENKKTITFVDTPGHEAFTAMRARGAKVTDLAIIIIAADDGIMPRTEEAISHVKAADVPIIFAINKVDKPNADPQKIKQQLAERNLLVEEWGGQYQSVDISAKKGINIDKLLDEVLLAAEILELKANPDKNATGTVIEAGLDRGRGYVTTVLIAAGTLKKGDIIRSGAFSGRVKAMYNERDQEIQKAGPSKPVTVLGLNGAPVSGEQFIVMDSEREAKDLAQKYGRIKREQELRARKHITLDEIARRIKIGNFQQLNVIIKSDVIGSCEALADSFIKLSTEEIQVNIIHKGVGQISEADVGLAAVSDAIIIGFQIRPSLEARKLAEREQIEIRTYSVIYTAIEELKAAMEGMLSPEIQEEIKSTIEVREVFKISKVGSIAGCYVMDGKISKKDKVRLLRDGVVVYTGEINELKRFKDDVKEVGKGYECGLSIENFNDIKKDDIIESFIEVEIAKKL